MFDVASRRAAVDSDVRDVNKMAVVVRNKPGCVQGPGGSRGARYKR